MEINHLGYFVKDEDISTTFKSNGAPKKLIDNGNVPFLRAN